MKRVPCIYYLVQFKRDTAEVQAFIDSRNEINSIAPAYAKKLGFWLRKTDVGVQKIDRSILKTYDIVIVGFQVQDKFEKARFFQETSLIADTSVEVVFGMPFLTLSKVKIDFIKKELIWKTYTIAKTLLIIKKVQIISPKECAKATLNQDQKAFVVHVTTLFNPMKMHPDQKVQIAAWIADEVLVTILAEYLDFEDIFSKESAAVLPEHIEINTHAIDLEKSK